MTDLTQDVSEINASLQTVINVLDRRIDIPVLNALVAAVRGVSEDVDITKAAIGIDANVFLRIPGHRRGSDIMDYLTGVHSGPLVLPGQAIQEFWNNQLNATDSVYKAVAKKHTELFKETEKYKVLGLAGIDDVATAVEKYKIDNEHIFDPDVVAKTTLFLERLPGRATVPFVPRMMFSDIAANRKRSKTPPGFKDDGDGDFYIWADLLWGLLNLKSVGAEFQTVILLSQDAKIDWSRGRIPHPVLSAEAKAVLNADFVIWNLDQFAESLL